MLYKHVVCIALLICIRHRALTQTESPLRVDSFDTCLLTPRLYLEVYYFLSLTLSVCMSVSPSVTLLLQIASSFLFLGGIEQFFGRHFPCGTL